MQTAIVASCLAVIGYFGFYAVWGDRGYLALQSTRKTLAEKTVVLDAATVKRKQAERRLNLLKNGDADMQEEIAHQNLVLNGPGQVAVPRDSADRAAPQP